MTDSPSNVVALASRLAAQLRDNRGFAISSGQPVAVFPVTTHRVYLRWPDGHVSDKTTTESREVADFAYKHLLTRPASEPEGRGPIGVAWTENGKQIYYCEYEVDDDSNGEADRAQG